MTFILPKIIADHPTQILQQVPNKIEQPMDVKGKLKSLLHEIRESRLLPTELAIKLEIFDQKFQVSYPYSFKYKLADTILHNASMDLCYFDWVVIHKAMIQYEGNKNIQIQILLFEDKLIEILKMILPSGLDPALFLDDYVYFCQNELREQIKANVAKVQEIQKKILAFSQRDQLQERELEQIFQQFAVYQVKEASRIGHFMDTVNGTIIDLTMELGSHLKKVELILTRLKKMEIFYSDFQRPQVVTHFPTKV
jgi:hypothetical protein